jgi:hypothetical protein
MDKSRVLRTGIVLSCFMTGWCFIRTATAGLDTDAHVGDLADGETVKNADGSYTVFDEGGVGDIWTDGDDFQYYYDSKPWSGDFSATVRVVSSTEDIGGRWGKAGLMIRDNLEFDSPFVMFEQHTGNERLIEPPLDGNGDVPRLVWRTEQGTGTAGDFNNDDNRHDFLDAPAPLPPEPGGVPIWFRVDRAGDVFTGWWSLDAAGTPAMWQDKFSTGPVPNLADPVTIGVAYSAHAALPIGLHGVTFDNFNVVGSAVTPGDFDSDGDIDAADIDRISLAVRNGETGSQFDLDGNGSVNANDRSHLIGTIKKTYLGDSTLDREFNSSDFVAVFTIGEYEDAVGGNSGWADGDWTGDGDFNSGDFVAAFTEGGYEKGPHPAVQGVPEPSSLVLLGMAGLMLLRRRVAGCACSSR